MIGADVGSDTRLMIGVDAGNDAELLMLVRADIEPFLICADRHNRARSLVHAGILKS
jgi:hypothetical protein